jgi:hypothetical protein
MTARRFEALLLGLALGAVLMLLARSQDFGRLMRTNDAREDSIAEYKRQEVALKAEVQHLTGLAFQRDTVLVAVTDTVIREVARHREDGQASADSLRSTLDSVQSVHLANLESSHRAEVAAIQRLADNTRLWGESWRALAITQDSLIAAQSAQLALHGLVNAGLRQALVREKQQVWLSRSAAVLGVVAVLVLK